MLGFLILLMGLLAMGRGAGVIFRPAAVRIAAAPAVPPPAKVPRPP